MYISFLTFMGMDIQAQGIRLYNSLLDEGILCSVYDTIEPRCNGTISFKQFGGPAPEVRYSNGNLYLVLDEFDDDSLFSLNAVAPTSLRIAQKIEAQNGYRDREPLVKLLKKEPDGIMAATTVIDQQSGRPTLAIYTHDSRMLLKSTKGSFDKFVLVR